MKIYTQKEWEGQKKTVTKDTADFEYACMYFRQICGEIGKLIGNNDFKGGYDDMTVFYEHDAYKTDKGMQLAIAWSGCNDLCKYEAGKLGIDSPEWWYRCWQSQTGQQ